MLLTDRQIKNAKPKEKAYKLTDGKGLYLFIKPNASKLWRFDYSFNGKRKTLSFGAYPEIALNKARELYLHAKKMLADGIDPNEAKQEAKRIKQVALGNTFKSLAMRWHIDNLHRWKVDHAKRVMLYLENDVFPHIGDKAITEIGVRDVKAVLQKILDRNAIETADKIRQWIGSVFEYAMLLELVSTNPAAPLRKIMPRREVEHMPALPQSGLVEFYRRLMLADLNRQNQIAMLLIMLVFVRSNELRGGLWQEIDFEQAIWTIPAERMKRPRLHIIPLPSWALELLRELHDLTGKTPFLFPSRTKINAYICENTLSAIMHRLGYKGMATPHGFRSLASSTLNEQGFNRDAIERQLAHVESDRVRAAYNRADYMAERREMMQWYADFLRKHFDEAMAILNGTHTSD
ncbi:MAG: integrase arm-type DNA-binding domain-containing protein [Neisseria sp.]|nr:integrase arm-type DNA-binding domain-containing protein [Neisseria sp.]